jgi:arabinogalactan oligomer/maltooligosaccharide transport system permease protein
MSNVTDAVAVAVPDGRAAVAKSPRASGSGTWWRHALGLVA